MRRRSILAGLGLLVLGAALGAGGLLAWQQTNPASPDRLAPRSLEGTVYLPLHDNQGKPFPHDQWQGAVEVFVRRFGGATLGDRRTGFWRDGSGKVQGEPVQLLTVSFDRDRLDEFRAATREVARRLGQESVYVRFEEPHVELIERPAAGGKKDR